MSNVNGQHSVISIQFFLGDVTQIAFEGNNLLRLADDQFYFYGSSWRLIVVSKVIVNNL
ncbi:MAG: hypothetical protein F6K39_11630 [Okeania sp. SIO3B3]|nr:hypothetical protein [Okeania sp. SIO3B3]